MMSGHSWASHDDDLVGLANDLLERLHVSGNIKHWTEINADVFVTLLEGLSGGPLPDAIRHPRCKEDEIHNCQSVMETLEMDLLNTSLSHISGRDIVNKDRVAISNLLSVFADLFDYMIDKISSDVSGEDDLSDVDPDLVTPEYIDSILEKELKKTHDSSISKSSAHNSLTSYSEISPHWPRSSRTHNYSKTSNGLKAAASGLSPKYHTVSGVLPQYTSAHTDFSSFESPKFNVTDSTTSAGELTSNRISSLAASIDQARRGVDCIDQSSAAQRTQLSNHRTMLASTGHERDVSNINSLSDLKTTAMSATTQAATTRAATSSTTSEFHPTLNADRLGLSENVLPEKKHQGPFDNLGIRKPNTSSDLSNSIHTTGLSPAEQAIHHKHTHYLYHYVGKDSTKPASHTSATHKTNSHPLAASLPLSGSVSHRECQRKTNSYENLQNLVRDTVEISRAAISSGPTNSHVAASCDASPKRESQASSHKTTLGERTAGSSTLPSSNVTSVKLRQTNTLSSQQSSQITSQKYSPKKNVSFITDPTPVSKPIKPRCKTAKSRHASSEQIKASPIKEANDTALSNTKPRTVKEYLLKYYGHERIRSYSDGDVKSDSDEEDYRGVIEEGNEVVHFCWDKCGEKEQKFIWSTAGTSQKPTMYEKQLKEKAKKMVKFHDIISDSAPDKFGNLRSKTRKEGDRSRLQTDYIDKVYKEDLIDHEDEVFERLKEAKKKAKQVENQYKNALKGRTKKYQTARRHKSSVGRLNKRTRSRSALVHGPKRSLSCSPTVGRQKVTVSDGNLMPWLLEEFPYIHISPQTLHQMWNKSARQLEQLSKVQREVKCKKSKAEVQIEEAEMKQKILSEIMKKELKHNERLNEIKERRKQVQSVKAKIRERRLQSARCRKYYEEYHVRNRSRMLKKKTKEELIFRRLFEDALNMQKERIRELRKYAREQQNEKARKQQDHLESLENYYKDQYNMLMETLAREREELDIRERAQSKVLNSLKRELQKKMEKEIREFQEQLYRDEDEAYFRQIDADRIRHQLNLTRYQAKI